MSLPEVGTDLKQWAKSFKTSVENLLAGVRSADDLIPDCGEIYWYPGALIPTGSLECNGQVLIRRAWPELFAVIQTRFNTGGEPLDAFRLPNLVAFTPKKCYCLIRATGKRATEVPLGPPGTM